MDQLKQVKKMGPLEGIIGMLPGGGRLKELGGACPAMGSSARWKPSSSR